jgi:hypothetical protein
MRRCGDAGVPAAMNRCEASHGSASRSQSLPMAHRMTAPKESGSPPPRITPLLEAVAAAAGVMPWGVAAIPSLGCVLLWDCRPDASAAIIEAVAGQEGAVGESHAIDMQGGTIIGILMTPHPVEGMDLEDFAGSLRLRYAIATGPDPDTTENPF